MIQTGLVIAYRNRLGFYDINSTQLKGHHITQPTYEFISRTLLTRKFLQEMNDGTRCAHVARPQAMEDEIVSLFQAGEINMDPLSKGHDQWLSQNS